jgi:hypothetical protein
MRSERRVSNHGMKYVRRRRPNVTTLTIQSIINERKPPFGEPRRIK